MRERERELSLSALLGLLPLLQFKTDLSFHRLWHGLREREREKEGKREREIVSKHIVGATVFTTTTQTCASTDSGRGPEMEMVSSPLLGLL